ncbi:MAG: branched-chain amino acid ABC transporter permease [Burkholderiales bacterium]
MNALLNRNRLLLWGAIALLLIVLPLVFRQSFALSMLSQMGIAIIFALSYNMLLGQTGLLSFGHAVYFGLGAFFCAHALNFMGAGKFWFPVTLVPLIGGLAGLVFGLLFGFVTTRRAGTPFAMISLGIAEMVAASALMFTAFFGGEGGISTTRTVGKPILGISYGPQIQVYYLIAGWCLICAMAMFALTQTPLGRMANAVRDNPERAQFVGYNPTRVRWLMMALAGFFAGIGGGLAAINYEIVTAETLGVMASGNVVLMAFIGGIGHFWGPILGAMLVTLLQSALSNYTQAWLLYFGLFFLAMIMFSPGGMANLISLHKPVWHAGLLRRLVPSYLVAGVCGLVMLAGFCGLIELIYHHDSTDAGAKGFSYFGVLLDPGKASAWIGMLGLLAVGLGAFLRTSRRVRSAWEELTPALQARSSA